MSKTILITGSTDGIGKLTAIKLAKEGHSMYIHGRNETKLKTVIAEIKEASNNQQIKDLQDPTGPRLLFFFWSSFLL